jgi:hypothetical protein
MLQQGQVFELATRGRDGKRVWAYRYRAGGRTRSACSAAASAVRRTRARRWSAFWRGSGARVGWREGRPLADFVDEFLENHIYRDDAVGLFSKRTHRLERCPASKPMSELRSRPS